MHFKFQAVFNGPPWLTAPSPNMLRTCSDTCEHAVWRILYRSVAKIIHCGEFWYGGEFWTLWRKLNKVAKIAIFVAKIKLIIRDKVVLKNSIEFTNGPSVCIFLRCNTQFGTVNIANPFGKLGWKPAQNRMRCSVLIGYPLSAFVTGQHLLAARSNVCRKFSPSTSGLQQMDV